MVFSCFVFSLIFGKIILVRCLRSLVLQLRSYALGTYTTYIYVCISMTKNWIPDLSFGFVFSSLFKLRFVYEHLVLSFLDFFRFCGQSFIRFFFYFIFFFWNSWKIKYLLEFINFFFGMYCKCLINYLMSRLAVCVSVCLDECIGVGCIWYSWL